jgi:hypothetical protein
VTTIEKSVGVRVPANEHEGTAGYTAEDTPHGGVVTSNRPDERTDATPLSGAEANAVTHHGTTSRSRHAPVPGSLEAVAHRHAGYGQHMA